MTQFIFKTPELQTALDDARSAFLGSKISIDDVSSDIKALENELNNYGANDEFIFLLQTVDIPEVGRQIEDYDLNAPILHRRLQWQKHGERWRLFYKVIWCGWDLYSMLNSPHEHCSVAEVDAVEALITANNLDDTTPTFNLPAGTELISKPLIDTSADIRLSVHPYLVNFIAAFAKDWTENKYRRSTISN